jgi:hypothetical protein
MRIPYTQLDSARRTLRDTVPAFLATCAKTSTLAKFIRGRLDQSKTEGTTLTAPACFQLMGL